MIAHLTRNVWLVIPALYCVALGCNLAIVVAREAKDYRDALYRTTNPASVPRPVNFISPTAVISATYYRVVGAFVIVVGLGLLCKYIVGIFAS